ncbi:MAG: TlpA family protein disulfide reductase [Fibromonadaceae bacterium]|jgi:thiol-disulfide isomerase/thioredoxin|nr:TlpA family protein disulfide reductase [Fibromonadaceae bacterium]
MKFLFTITLLALIGCAGGKPAAEKSIAEQSIYELSFESPIRHVKSEPRASVLPIPMDFDIKLDNIKNNVLFSTFSSRPLLIYFYSHYCQHCHTVYPGIRQLVKEYEKNGLAFIAISTGFSSKKDALLFMEQHNEYDTAIPFFYDSDNEFGQIYGDGYVPRLFLVFQDGKVIRYTNAFSEGLKKVKADLDNLFGIEK